MVRDYDSSEWNLRDLQESIRKEVWVSESEHVTSHSLQSFHPTATFHTDTTNQPNAANQRSCAFCKGSIACRVVTDNI